MRASSVRRPLKAWTNWAPQRRRTSRPRLRTGTEAEKRGAATFLIGRVTLNDDATLEALIEVLSAGDDVLRHSALQAVEKLPDEQLQRALTTLVELAKNNKEEYGLSGARGARHRETRCDRE